MDVLCFRLGDDSSETDAAVVAVETQGKHVPKLISDTFLLCIMTVGFAQPSITHMFFIKCSQVV